MVSDAEKLAIAAGGNRGGRPRNDGLPPGSEAAKQADRDADAKRKRDSRAAASARRMAERPQPLPSLAATNAPEPSASAGVESDQPSLEALQWVAADFNQAAVDAVNLADDWNVQRKVKKCVEGKLPRALVDQIASDVRFPAAAKASLCASSPAGLARLFNAAHVPLSFKPIIVGIPALTWLIVRDLQISDKIDKAIAEEAERTERKQPEQKT